MNIPALLIEIICLLASMTLYFQVSIPVYLKLFPVFLLITILVETIAFYLGRSGVNVYPLYSLFTTFEFEFYLYIIRNILQDKRARKIISYTMIIYPVLVALNMLFVQGTSFLTITYSLGCLLIVTASIYYFFEIFKLPKSVNLQREPAFWLCSALLFFYCCSFPLIGLINFLRGLPEVIIRNLTSILTILNILLYSLFSIAFLCKIRLKKRAI